MLPILLSILGPLLGKVVDTVGSKLGVNMDSDEVKGKKLELELELQKMIQETDLEQLKINEAEASNPNRRWPTWRECLGYVCVIAVGYHFVIQQVLAFILSSAGVAVSLPELEMSGLMTILSAMLGVHFVDSRYNSPIGTPPSDQPKPKGYVPDKGKVVDGVWIPD